jgi:hypothetical protein
MSCVLREEEEELLNRNWKKRKGNPEIPVFCLRPLVDLCYKMKMHLVSSHLLIGKFGV